MITKEPNQSACVKGLMSAEGETLDLVRVLRVRGNVEMWMGLVETAMFEVRGTRAQVINIIESNIVKSRLKKQPIFCRNLASKYISYLPRWYVTRLKTRCSPTTPYPITSGGRATVDKSSYSVSSTHFPISNSIELNWYLSR